MRRPWRPGAWRSRAIQKRHGFRRSDWLRGVYGVRGVCFSSGCNMILGHDSSTSTRIRRREWRRVRSHWSTDGGSSKAPQFGLQKNSSQVMETTATTSQIKVLGWCQRSFGTSTALICTDTCLVDATRKEFCRSLSMTLKRLAKLTIWEQRGTCGQGLYTKKAQHRC